MTNPTGRIIKRGAVRTAAAGVAPSAEPAAAPSCAHDEDVEPRIELHREGDTVVAIEITCGCGRTTVIECDYGEEQAR